MTQLALNGTYTTGLPTGPIGPLGPQNANGTFAGGTPAGFSSYAATTPAVSAPSATGSVTAKSAHDMLISVSLELVFVVVMTMLAGISDSWGSGILALMILLLLLRGLLQVNIFGNFVTSHPLTPPTPAN